MSDIHLIKGLGAEKKLGQNFLVDPHYIERELSCCNTKGKNVLEIGPGVGALTVGLAKDAKSFLAIEIDERFIPILAEKLLEFKHAKVICGDALEFAGGPFDLVVSNVPYYVASKMVLKISELGDEAVICIQRELADRMVAKPGSRDYSRFSVICQILFETKFLGAVPSGAFYPKPDVGSAFVRLKKIGEVSDELSNFTNAVFQHRNKKLRNAIIDSREMLQLQKEKAAKIGDSLSLHGRRVITLSKEEVIAAFEEFENKNELS